MTTQTTFKNAEELNQPYMSDLWTAYLNGLGFPAERLNEAQRETILEEEKKALLAEFQLQEEAQRAQEEKERKQAEEAAKAQAMAESTAQPLQPSVVGAPTQSVSAPVEMLLTDESPQAIREMEMSEVIPDIDIKRVVQGFEPTHSHVAKLDECYAPPIKATRALLRWMLTGDRRKSFKLTGPTGSGKTALTSYISAKLGWKLMTVPCDSQLTPASLRGFMSLKNGETQFQLASVAYAYKHGYLLVMDEGDRLSEQCDSFLNVIAEGRPLVIPETGEVIHPHANFRLVMTGNTNGAGDLSGLYPDTKMACVSSQNRYRVAEVQYLDLDTELKVIRKAYPAFPKDLIVPILEAVSLARDAFLGTNTGGEPEINIAISTRSILDWISAMLTDPEEAMEVTFEECISGLGDKESEATVTEFFSTKLGETFTDPNWFAPYKDAISGGIPQFYELYEYQAKGEIFEVCIAHDDDSVYMNTRKNKRGKFKLHTITGADLKGLSPIEYRAQKVTGLMKRKAKSISENVQMVNGNAIINN